MSFVKDSLLVIGRIYTIYPLLLVIALFMGRRSIGQLPVFDFLIFLSLGSVVGADIADPKVEHIHTAVAVVAIGLLQKLFAFLVVKYRSFNKLVTFEPVIVISTGQLMKHNLRKLQYSIEDVLGMLREQGIFDPAAVELAILEGNGQLSVLHKKSHQPLTEELSRNRDAAVGLSYPVIREGRLLSDTLIALHLTEQWLHEKLRARNLVIEDIFYASVDDKNVLTVTPNKVLPKVPPLKL